jgi:hypothetical protein
MLTAELSADERDRILEQAAGQVVRRRLEVPAVMFLEMNRPLSFLASQGLIVLTPLFGTIFGPERMMKLAQLMEDRSNIDRLLQRIEALSRAARGGPSEPALAGPAPEEANGAADR